MTISRHDLEPDPVEAARLLVTHDETHAFSAVAPPIVPGNPTPQSSPAHPRSDAYRPVHESGA